MPPGAPPTCNPTSQTLLCWPDQGSSGSVTSITAGNGLDATPANPITGVGTIFVDAPVCSASSEKLQWDGSAFQCGVDEGSADISARVFNNADITIANSVATVLTFNSELWDTDSIHSTSINTSRLTATTAGKYYIFGHVLWAENPTGLRKLRIQLNGSDDIATIAYPAVSEGTFMSVSTAYDLAAGDYVQLEVRQLSGGALNVQVNEGQSGEFGMVKLP